MRFQISPFFRDRIAQVLPVMILAISIAPSSFASDLRFETTHIDMGIRYNNRPFEAPFTVRNVGLTRHTVKVNKVSCGCIAPVGGSIDVAPGAEERIVLGYDPRSSGLRSGNNSFSADVSTTDPQMKRVLLEVNVELAGAVSARPRELNLTGPVPGISTGSLLFEIVCLETPILPEITGIAAPTDGFKVSKVGEKAIQGGVAHSFSLDVDAKTLTELVAGVHPGSLVIKTDSPEAPVLEIPIKMEAERSLPSVESQKLQFGIVSTADPKKSVSLEVLIAEDAVAPFTADISHQALSVSLEEIGDGDSRRILVRVNLDVTKGDFSNKRIFKENVAILDSTGRTLAVMPAMAIVKGR